MLLDEQPTSPNSNAPPTLSLALALAASAWRMLFRPGQGRCAPTAGDTTNAMCYTSHANALKLASRKSLAFYMCFVSLLVFCSAKGVLGEGGVSILGFACRKAMFL